jgi:hypothetical protein
MKRRIEYLESINTIEVNNEPALARQLKNIYADVDIDFKTFCARLASIQE